jgi:hypothetical protein
LLYPTTKVSSRTRTGIACLEGRKFTFNIYSQKSNFYTKEGT